jgi:peptide deformylase
MADFTLFQMPDAAELLHCVSAAVDIQDPQWDDFGQRLLDFMTNINMGVAISAIQVGHPWRFFVMDLSRRISDRKYQLRKVLNPEILERSPSIVLNSEGCLSVPDTYDVSRWIPVKRSISIRVRYWTPRALLRAGGRVMEIPSEQVETVLEGAEAFAFQHELDHLDGRLITDHAPAAADPGSDVSIRLQAAE